jgi:hypothetical protein
MALVESPAPVVDLLAERIQINPVMLGGIRRQVPAGPFQQGSAADVVPRRIMMKGDRDLDQALKELAFGFRRGAPDILQDFVGFIEPVLFEEPKTFSVRIGRHSSNYARNDGREVGHGK